MHLFERFLNTQFFPFFPFCSILKNNSLKEKDKYMSIEFDEKNEYPGLENKFPAHDQAPKIPNLSSLNPSSKEEVHFDEKQNHPFFSFLKEIIERLKKEKRRFFIGLSAFFFAIFLPLISVWGFTQYQKVNKKVSFEQLLPHEVGGVFRVAIKEDSPQVLLLEQLARKFPGYEYIQKELDTSSEGKTVDESFLDSWKKSGLSFEEDLLPAIGDWAWLVLPDFSPIEKAFGDELALFFDTTKNASFAKKHEKTSSPFVLGREDDLSGGNVVSQDETSSQKLDFILGSEITNRKKVLEIIEKIPTQNEDFAVVRDEYKGYSFFEFTLTSKSLDDSYNDTFGLSLSSMKTYHGIIGSQWVISSRKDWFLESIDRHYATLLFSLSSSEENRSLSDNAEYRKVMDSLGYEENDLMTAYYRWGIKNSCGDLDFCRENFKDEDVYEGGFSVRVQEDGVALKVTDLSEKIETKREKTNFQEGFATRVPKKNGQKWADVFYEISDAKTAYYDFKRGRTESDLEEWDSYLEDISRETGVHIERDIIDRISGNAGVSLFTAKALQPDIVFFASMEKGSDFLEGLFAYFAEQKNTQVESQRAMCALPENAPYCEGGIEMSTVSAQKQNVGKGTLYRLDSQGKNDERKDLFTTVFSYDFCGGILPSYDMALLSTSCASVQGILEDVSSETLSKDAEYVFSDTYVGQEGFDRLHIVPLGIVYAYYGIITSSMNSFLDEEETMKKDLEEEWSAFLAVAEGFAKTIPSLTIQSKSDHTSTLFMHIKELPSDQKERAEVAIRKISSSLDAARSRARVATYKATLSALVPELIACCEEGKTFALESGEAICSGTFNELPFAQDLGVDSVRYNTVSPCNRFGQFEFEVTVSGGDGSCSGSTRISPQTGVVFPEGC